MTPDALKQRAADYLEGLTDADEHRDAKYHLAAFLEWLYPTPKIHLPVRTRGDSVIDAKNIVVATCSDADGVKLLADTLNKGTP